ncbi:MAG: aminotransferase class IV [Bacteroidota bacterium]
MVNFNGTLLNTNEKLLHHSNRGFRLGDVLFEEIRVLNGKILFWEEHYFRLMASMRVLRMDIPMEFTMEHLEKEILVTLNRNNLIASTTLVTLSIFRSSGNTVTTPTDNVSYIIEAERLTSPFYTMDSGPYEVELFKDYFLGRDMLSKLDTNNKIVEVIADVFAHENRYTDCILLNDLKQVVRTISGSLFLVKDDNIKTPSTTNGAKNTVLRKKLLELISSLEDYAMEEAPISPFELQKADELFILSISKGIQPVTRYRKKAYESKVSMNLLGKLNAHIRLANLK